MQPVKKDRCGYDEYKCVGLGDIAPIFYESFCIDNKNYDHYITRGSDSVCSYSRFPASNSEAPGNLNFYNVATTFQGPVLSTPFLPIAWDSGKARKCYTSLQPFGSGLVDAWDTGGLKKSVKHVADGKTTNAAQGDTTISSYDTRGALDGFQPVGVLTPSSRLPAFDTPQAVAVPIVRPGGGGGGGSGISGMQFEVSDAGARCSGFQASGQMVDGCGTMKFTVNGGKVIYNGVEKSVSKFSGSTTDETRSVFINKIGSDSNVKFDMSDSSGGQSMLIASFRVIKMHQTNNSYNRSCYVQVTQAHCSPVIWTSLPKLTNTTDKFVLANKNGTLQWIKIYSC